MYIALDYDRPVSCVFFLPTNWMDANGSREIYSRGGRLRDSRVATKEEEERGSIVNCSNYNAGIAEFECGAHEVCADAASAFKCIERSCIGEK